MSDLHGIKIQVLAIVERMTWPEASAHGSIKVLKLDNLYTAISHEACSLVTTETLSKLME